MNTPDTEFTLSNGLAHVYVSPYGASLRGLVVDGQPVITVYHDADNKVGGEGDVLIPFPGRIREGQYSFDGHDFQMVKNDKEGPNAIHGFLRTVLWEVVEHTETEAVFAIDIVPGDHPGYPFALHTEVHWQATPTGLSCAFTIENRGDTPAPVAAGFHPYFTVGTDLIDTDILTVPFASTLEYDTGMLPTGTVVSVGGTPNDFQTPRAIAQTEFNTCYLHPQRGADGTLAIVLSDPDTDRTVSVSFGETINYVVLYSGDPLPPAYRRHALAIEPMTCGSDAFNFPQWGLAAVAPGQSLTGEWHVDAA